MDIFAQGSLRESYGVAVVEAMAMKLPVVATDVDGFREVVDHGKTGLLVPVNCPKEMCDAFSLLAKNPELRQEMGRRGREKVEKKYNFHENVKQMLAVYEKARTGKVTLPG